MAKTHKYTAFTDGASSGNPGHSGIGIVIYRDGEELFTESKYIGETTNNVAEYSALLHLLELCELHKIHEIDIFADSELVVKQIAGLYKIKNDNLRVFATQINAYKKKIKFTLTHVRREHNTVADKLSKIATKRGERLDNV